MTQWGLDTLFNPAKRHMDEEKQRLQSTREEVGDNSGGKRINFESGRITIKRADAAGDALDADTDGESTGSDEIDAESGGGDEIDAASTDAESAHDSDPAAETASTGDAVTSTTPQTKKLTPAQLRAAQRRGRTPK